MEGVKEVLLITGATGQQGGALADLWASFDELKQKYNARAIIRNFATEVAYKLAASGIELVKGDLDNTASISQALDGVSAVFLVTTPFGKKFSTETEERHARNVIDAAAKSGKVTNFIYTSVEGSARATQVPHFASKARIEKYLNEKSASLGKVTILHPVVFLDMLHPVATSNDEDKMRNFIVSALRTYLGALPSSKKLHFVACSDIAKAAARALLKPDIFGGKSVTVCGDEINAHQIEEIVAKHFGGNSVTPLKPHPLPKILVKLISSDLHQMFTFFAESGYIADVPKLQAEIAAYGPADHILSAKPLTLESHLKNCMKNSKGFMNGEATLLDGFMCAHISFRFDALRFWARCCTANLATKAERERLQKAWTFTWDMAIGPHHHGEDDLIWPFVKALCPDAAAAIDASSAEHGPMHDFEHKIKQLLSTLVKAPEGMNDDIKALQRELAATALKFRVDLVNHLDAEEKLIWPILALRMNAAEIKRVEEVILAHLNEAKIAEVSLCAIREAVLATGNPHILKRFKSAFPAILTKVLIPIWSKTLYTPWKAVMNN